LVVVLLDLVSSGGPLGSQLLPDFYRWLAPGMPVAQLYSGMRGALYFDNAGIGNSIALLSTWLAGGVVLIASSKPRAPLRRELTNPAATNESWSGTA
jgi:hypothetical protein